MRFWQKVPGVNGLTYKCLQCNNVARKVERKVIVALPSRSLIEVVVLEGKYQQEREVKAVCH